MTAGRFDPPPLTNPEGAPWASLGAVAGGGEVGGDRHYDGAGLGAFGVWKCPACRVEHTTPFEQGCPNCGAGVPGYHVGNPPPPPRADQAAPAGNVHAHGGGQVHPSAAFTAVREDLDRGMAVYAAAGAWGAAHEEASLAEAFVAGYQLAHQQAIAHTMQAAPVTADVEQLAPAGKARRTIVAALRLFKDQVLTQTPDEIESGEWCSLEEADALIQQLEGS